MKNRIVIGFVFAAGVFVFSFVFSGCGPGNTANNKMNMENKANTASDDKTTVIGSEFKANLPADLVMPSDPVGQRLLKEYGALFIAQGKVALPKTVIFKDAAEVSAWQSAVSASRENIGGIEIELQTTAMAALKEAIGEAQQNGLNITPRGADAARRSYQETETLWASRVNPGLDHWTGNGKLSQETAGRIRALSPFEQVPEIFKLEAEGMYFSKDLSKSIVYSVAPPGTSQHLSMLALDVSEHENAKIRDILARHGWFQTVVSDLPHFTFLGVEEKDLPSLGLKKVENSGRAFWVPN